NWKEVMVVSLNKYDHEGAYDKGLRVAQSLIFEYPEEAKLYRSAAQMCLKKKDYKKAAFYLRKFNQMEKSSSSAQELADVYIKLNQFELAHETVSEAINRGFDDEALNTMVKEINQMIKKRY